MQKTGVVIIAAYTIACEKAFLGRKVRTAERKQSGPERQGGGPWCLELSLVSRTGNFPASSTTMTPVPGSASDSKEETLKRYVLNDCMDAISSSGPSLPLTLGELFHHSVLFFLTAFIEQILRGA